MQHITIDRSKWWYGQRMSALVDDKGCGCILGLILQAVGADPKDLRSNGMPADMDLAVDAETRGFPSEFLRIFDMEGPPIWAIGVNDAEDEWYDADGNVHDVSNLSSREALLHGICLDLGVCLSFTGEPAQRPAEGASP